MYSVTPQHYPERTSEVSQVTSERDLTGPVGSVSISASSLQKKCGSNRLVLGCRVYQRLFVLSHKQHLVRPKRVWSLGSVRLRWCECNHLPSKLTLVRFAWDVKANAPRLDPVLQSICLFGRNGHPLSRAHYGNYCLISGNFKTNSTLSGRRVKMTPT